MKRLLFLLLVVACVTAWTDKCGFDLPDSQFSISHNYTTKSVANGTLAMQVQNYSEDCIIRGATSSCGFYFRSVWANSTPALVTNFSVTPTVSGITQNPDFYSFDHSETKVTQNRTFFCDVFTLNSGDTVNTNGAQLFVLNKSAFASGFFNFTILLNVTGGLKLFVDPGVSACGTISSSGTYTLTQDLSSAGTCLTVTAENVILDGGGWTISYQTTPQTAVVGVDYEGANYSTTKGLHVYQAGGFGSYSDYAFNYVNSKQSNLSNSTAFQRGSNCHGMYASHSDNLSIGPGFFYNNTGDTGSICYFQASNGAVINGTTGNTYGNSQGFYSDGGGANHRVINNSWNDYGDNGKNVWISGGGYATVSDNNFSTSGSYSYGTYIENGGYNFIRNNFYNLSLSGGNNARGVFLSNCGHTNVSKNTILAAGSTGGRTLDFDQSPDGIIEYNNIRIESGDSAGIYSWSNARVNMTYNNVTVSSTSGAIYTDTVTDSFFMHNRLNSTNAAGYALALATSSGTIRSVNNTFYSKNVSVYLSASTSNFSNDNIVACTVACATNPWDVWLTGGSTAGFLNSTIRENVSGYGSGSNNLNTRNYLRVHASYANGTNVRAVVNVTDYLGVNVMYETADVNGLTNWNVYRDFSGTNTANVSWLPLNITAVYDGVTNTTWNASALTYQYEIVFASSGAPTPGLVVNLTSPANGAVSVGSKVTFVGNASSGYAVQNSTLWGNFSGSWAANVTQAGSANFTQLVSGLTKGVYLWNVRFCDTQGCGFDSSANRTIDVRYASAPIVNLTTPTNNTVQNLPVLFIANASSNYSTANVTLYGNFSGAWAANDSFVGNVNLSDSTVFLASGAWLWNAKVCDFYGQCSFDTSGNRTLVIGSPAPLVVNLTFPANGAVKVGPAVTFVGNASSGQTILNSTLWGNFSGVWAANVTQAGNLNFSQLVGGLSKGVYLWNVRFCDSTACGFDSSANRTLDVRFSYFPTVNLTTPANKSTANLPFSFTATALSNYSLANWSLWGNFSGAWARNDTVTTTNNFSDSINFLADGAYFWNVLACDVFGQCSFDYSSNYTVTVSSTTTTTTSSTTTSSTTLGKGVTFAPDASSSYGQNNVESVLLYAFAFLVLPLLVAGVYDPKEKD